MSKRRKAGDIVWKKANAGFIGEPGLVQLQPEDETYGVDYCLLDCGDENCREWSTAWAVDSSGKPTGGVACHVAECEMEDAPSA